MKREIHCRICGSDNHEGEFLKTGEFVCKKCLNGGPDYGERCLFCGDFIIFGTEVEHDKFYCNKRE